MSATFVTILTVLAVINRLAQANPIPDALLGERANLCVPCRPTTSYSVGHQFDWTTDWKMIGGYSCTSTKDAPCTLQAGHEITVGVTVTAGLDLGLSFKDIFNAGVSGSVSYERSTTTTTAVQVGCPKGVWCGFMHQDGVLVVQGYKKVQLFCPDDSGQCGHTHDLSNDWYEVWMPKKASNGQILTKVVSCACPEGDMTKKPKDLAVCPTKCL